MTPALPPAPFPIVSVVGPTAVGKTEVSMRLAREIRAEILGVDSIQVYRLLDIGSAKPSRKEREAVPHHLIDILDPDEPFDAALFLQKARRAIASILSRGNTVLLVGGTGLYLSALLKGLGPATGEDPALRAQLRRIASTLGPETLHRHLERMDPASARRISPKDVFRTIRAMEIQIRTGRPASSILSPFERAPLGLPHITVGLIRDREELYRRIDERVDGMLAQGFVEEVKSLLALGYSPRLKPLQSLGYRHIIRFLQGEYSLEEAVSTLKRDTRRYAKRQITWFRADPETRWFHPDELMAKEHIWTWIKGGRNPS
ncbi:MAG: tRNA (adenosine(37)-N6)-dimethylallyltransferase MiaA [Deltaproteobacteria bacterium]